MSFNKISYWFMKNIVKIGIMLVICIALIIIGKKAFVTGQKVFSEKGVELEPGQDIQITIKNTDSNGDIRKNLEANNLIESDFVFWCQTKIYGVKKFKTGTYTLNTSYSPFVILDILKNGPGSENAISNGENYVPETNKASK